MTDVKTSAIPTVVTPNLAKLYFVAVLDPGGAAQTVKIPASAFVTSGAAQPAATPTNFTLTILAPHASDAVGPNAFLASFQAPGMQNVELKDPRGVLLFRSTPDANGLCSAFVDPALMQPGTQTLTADAWDAPPGQAFTHHDSKTVTVTVTTASDPVPAGISTPAAISGLNYRLVKNWNFGSNKSGATILNTTDLLTEFTPNLWYFGATNTANYSIQTDRLRLVLTRSGATIREATMASKWSGKFGYFEARMRCDNVTGSWPAFWLYPNLTDIQNSTNGGELHGSEIDIWETFNNGGNAPGGGADSFYSSGHAISSWLHNGTPASPPSHTNIHQKNNTVDTTAFFKLGLLWTSDGVTKLYLNDVLADTFTFGTWDDANPMVILDNWALAGGGDQGGGSIGGTGLADPATSNAEFDYVRVWQP